MNQVQEKKVVTQAEFQKRVEIEAQHLMYFNHMKHDTAFEQARQEVSQKYKVGMP